MVSEVEKIAKGLSARQKAALLAFPGDEPVRMADGKTIYSRAWRKASELGVSGNTLVSLNIFGGVDPKTLLAGPCLVTDDWSREGRHWSMTDLGLAVRSYLKGSRDD